jgi:hypothetical protein
MSNYVAFGFTGFTVNPSPLGKGDIGAQETGALTAELLQDRYRELFAVIDVNELGKALMAWFRLHAPMNGEVSITKQIEWGETAIYELLERGALRIIVQTPDVEADLEKLAAAVAKSNLRPQPSDELVQTESTGPTEAELDAAVINDWKTLLTSEIRSRCRDAAYKQRLDRLMAEGKI